MTNQESNKIKSIDLKTFATLIGVIFLIGGMVGTYAVQTYRVQKIEEKVELLSTDVKNNSELLLRPTFGLDDYIRLEDTKAKSQQRELDRRVVWRDSTDKFRREAEKAIASTSKDVETIKFLVTEIRADLKKINK